MSPDRFGTIRIKPDADKISPENRNGDQEDLGEKINSPVQVKNGTAELHLVSRTKKTRGFPFVPTRLLLWFALPLFMVLLYGVGSYFLVPSLVKGTLAKSLSENLGRPVVVNRVVFSPFTLHVYLETVSVGPVYGDTNKKNLLECSDFQCRINLPALFKKQLVCHEVKISGVELNVVRLRLGSFTIADAASFLSLIREKSGQFQWPPWLVFDGVQLTDGKVLIDDSPAQKYHRIEQISFYLPSDQEVEADIDARPRLNAVINASPVKVDGRRYENSRGEVETRFNLKFSEVVLKKYLDYLPALHQNPFHLTEGQAEITMTLVIPELKSELKKVTFQWDASITGLHYENGQGRTVLKVPEALLTVQALPSENQYILKKVEFNNPELLLSLKKTTEKQAAGVFLSELNNFIQGLDVYPSDLRIENFSLNGATLKVLHGKQKTPKYVWEQGQLRLTDFINQVARKNYTATPAAANFWLSGREKASMGKGQIKAEGRLHTPVRLDGQFSLTNIDLHKYSDLLPKGIHFTGGQADIESRYAGTFGANGSKNSSEEKLQLQEGKMTIRNYALLLDKQNVLSGRQLACNKMMVDGSKKDLSCGHVTLVKSRIDGNAFNLADLVKKKKNKDRWTVWAQNVSILDSTLLKQLDNPFAQDNPVRFEFNNVSLQAANLQNTDHANSSLKISAGIAEKGGSIALAGTYSPASNTGQLQTTLKNIKLSAVKEYFSPWLIPDVRGGLINAEGTYFIENNEFSGNIWLLDFLAGKENEASVAWKEAVAENLTVKLKPFALHCEAFVVNKPFVSFGVSHALKPLDVFIKPTKENSIQSLAILEVRFDKGKTTLPEPVVFKGYQPELSDLAGTLSSIGSESMDFKVQGTFEEQGRFSIQGETAIRGLNHYVLESSNVPLGVFQPLFAANIGQDVRHAKGSWQQEMSRSEAGLNVASRIHLQDVVADPVSEYFKINALYTDEKNSLLFASDVLYREERERPFLFDVLIRGLKRDMVRADLSEQLVLKKLLPELTLPGKVMFVPGTTSLVVTKELADYEKLLAKRPLLRLQLMGSYDAEQDAAALKKVLQEQEDSKREAENRRREAERRKIEESEKARLEALKKDSKQVVEETITPVELSQDLQPLPLREAYVQKEMLQELAQKRTDVLFDFFANGLLVGPEKVYKYDEIGISGSEVRITVEPYFTEPVEEKEIKKNDTSAH